MKNFSILILILVILPNNYLTAQWSIGVQGGINIARYELTNELPEIAISNKYGVIAGGIISFEISDNYFLMSGVRYIQKGGHAKINFPGFLTDNKVYYNFVEIPAYFNFSPFNSNIQPIIYGGVEMGYLLVAKSEGTVNGDKSENDYTEDFKKIDIALAGGFGLRFIIDNNYSYIFKANYSYGVINISEQITTRGIHFTFGVLYNL